MRLQLDNYATKCMYMLQNFSFSGVMGPFDEARGRLKNFKRGVRG